MLFNTISYIYIYGSLWESEVDQGFPFMGPELFENHLFLKFILFHLRVILLLFGALTTIYLFPIKTLA